MRTWTSRILCSAALLAALAPAFASQRPSAHLRGAAHLRTFAALASEGGAAIPDHVIPSGSGFGSGTYRLPATGAGDAIAGLYDVSGRLRYVIRASLLRSGEIPPPRMPDGGMFYGALLAVVGRDAVEPVAQVEGTWIREPSGRGAFEASILVPTEDIDHPLVEIGMIQGTLSAPLAVSQLMHLDATETSQRVTTLGRLAATWNVGRGD
jgi:hypothetical protein